MDWLGYEGDESPSNVETDVLLSWLADKISWVDGLLCAGGEPIDNRSRRASVPFCGTGFVPEKVEKNK